MSRRWQTNTRRLTKNDSTRPHQETAIWQGLSLFHRTGRHSTMQNTSSKKQSRRREPSSLVGTGVQLPTPPISWQNLLADIRAIVQAIPQPLLVLTSPRSLQSQMTLVTKNRSLVPSKHLQLQVRSSSQSVHLATHPTFLML